MAIITDTDGFVDVTRPEANDLALGGQEINFPGFHFRQLASRDRYLFNLIAGDDAAQSTFEEFKQVGIAAIAQGRLTLAPGNAVPSTDQVSMSSVFYTPYNGDYIALWNAAESRWDLRQFTELSLFLSGASSGTNYDIFAFWNGTEVELERVVWNTDDARDPSTQISQRNGVWVKTVDNRRYLGTIRTTFSGVTEDSRQNRFVWNVQNKVSRPLVWQSNTSSWTYSGATWRAINNDVLARVQIVAGLPDARVDLVAMLNVRDSGFGGIAKNATTIPTSVDDGIAGDPVSQPGDTIGHYSALKAQNLFGYNFFQMIERVIIGGQTATMVGVDSLRSRTGIIGEIDA